MRQNLWRFRKRKDYNTVIIVDGEESARVLWGILQDQKAEWTAEELTSVSMAAMPGLAEALGIAPTIAPPAPAPSTEGLPELQLEGFDSAKPAVKPAQQPTKPQTPQAQAPARPPAQAPVPQPPPQMEAQPGIAPPALFRTEKRAGRRRHVRYRVEFRVILVAGNRTFRTHSSDVSVGGILLKRQIPATLLNNNCKVFVATENMDETIQLDCQVVGDPENPCRIRFAESDTSSLKKLENWILKAAAERPGIRAA